MSEGPAPEQTFRDTLGIVSSEGKRKWITPKQPSGFYYRARTILSVILLAFLFGMPFVTVNGHPFMLFNILERKFIVFGSAFGPHDFYLFVLLMITVIVFIILFTVVFGRLFCGWVCPQTVLLEMVFRRIDYWIEGDHNRQRHLNAAPWGAGKLFRKLSRYALYFLLAFALGNTFLAWIIGLNQVAAIVVDPPSQHLAGLTAMLGFSALLYWIFIWFREQACILVCPYGRLQGVLLDPNSIVIAYDYRRGEPRGKLRRNAERTQGDCIDCSLCVDVCPTGIDIRNGTQLECVNCTACIDACDEVMTRIDKPTGLIRYDSARGIAEGSGFRWTARVVSYTLLLVVLMVVLTLLLINRSPIDVTILRTPGMFYQEQPDGRLSNVYDIKLLNKTFAAVPVRLTLAGVTGSLRVIGDSLLVAPQEVREGKLLLILDRNSLHGISTPVTITVDGGAAGIQTVATTFLGPGRTR
jgi:cytochrome c oxidase accessory protein FixG